MTRRKIHITKYKEVNVRIAAISIIMQRAESNQSTKSQNIRAAIAQCIRCNGMNQINTALNHM
jgi:hypothetical protein